MKKTLCILAVGILTSGLAFAKFTGATTASQGGFNGGDISSAIKTVKEVKSMWDDTWVTVRGNIVNRISEDKYTFRDSTGEIVVDIDSKYWAGVEVGPNDVVELSGEIDREIMSVKLDVKAPVKKVQ